MTVPNNHFDSNLAGDLQGLIALLLLNQHASTDKPKH